MLFTSLLLAATAADPQALWRIVHDTCMPEAAEHALVEPCMQVAPDGGWAVLKDIRGATQFLLVPTVRIGGIESAVVLAPDAPNYFQAAWAARIFVSARAGRDLPRDAIALAINSPFRRGQDQLHIHIDCVRPDVRTALRDHAAVLGPTWAPLPGGLLHQPYLARRLDGAELGAANPFQLLAAAPGVGAAGMRFWTIVVVGATFTQADGHGAQDGFVLLADRADPARGDGAHGEDLLDHACALAHEAAD